MKLFIALCLCASTALTAVASAQTEIKLPQESPAASVSHTIGTTEIAVVYHRPGVKGRTVWGELVPYGEVWRTGANDATTIRFADAVRVGGKDVPAGRYSFFAIPQRDKWTLILNKVADQWGAYAYDAKSDVVRFDVKPSPGPHCEWLTYTIDPLDVKGVTVTLAWEKLKVSFQVDVDVPSIVMKSIDEALHRAAPDDWAVYYDAAKYFYDNDLEPALAMDWIDRSLTIKETFRNNELKARLLIKAKQSAKAVAFLEKAIELSKVGQAPQGYIDGLSKLLGEAKAAR